MAREIDYYFYSASPFTYLGHQAIMDVAARHGAMLHYKPVNLMGIWEISGAVPPPKRPPVRQRYRLVEIERVADFRGLDINVKPADFPVDATLADMTAIAIMQSGGDPGAYLGSVFAACWAKDMNIGDESVIEGLLDDAGFDGASMVAAAKADEIAAIRDRNTEAAIAARRRRASLRARWRGLLGTVSRRACRSCACQRPQADHRSGMIG